MLLGRRDLMEDFLDQTKRTDIATDGSAKNHSDCQDKTEHIEAHPEPGCVFNRLHRSNGTGQPRCRTGIAIKARTAEVLPIPFVDLSGCNISNMAVCKTESRHLQ